MEFLGVGPLELVFIAIIALIIIGPKDMVKTGRTLGKALRKIVSSPIWRVVRETGQNLQELPNRLIREAGLEEDVQDLQNLQKDVRETVNSIDPRRISRSFSETFTPDPPPDPQPADPSETDSASGQDPAAETPPENPQV
jgi:sec-independent protein translocase protein TatB